VSSLIDDPERIIRSLSYVSVFVWHRAPDWHSTFWHDFFHTLVETWRGRPPDMHVCLSPRSDHAVVDLSEDGAFASFVIVLGSESIAPAVLRNSPEWRDELAAAAVLSS
jgi:hypothetical protein